MKKTIIIILIVIFSNAIISGCINSNDNHNNNEKNNNENNDKNEKSMSSSFEINIFMNNNNSFEMIVPICVNWDGTVSSLINNLEIIKGDVTYEIINTNLTDVQFNIGLKLIGKGNVSLKAQSNEYLIDFDEKNQNSITFSLRDYSSDEINLEQDFQGFPYWIFFNSLYNNQILINISLYFHRIVPQYEINALYEKYINGIILEGWQTVNSINKHISN